MGGGNCGRQSCRESYRGSTYRFYCAAKAAGEAAAKRATGAAVATAAGKPLLEPQWDRPIRGAATGQATTGFAAGKATSARAAVGQAKSEDILAKKFLTSEGIVAEQFPMKPSTESISKQ